MREEHPATGQGYFSLDFSEEGSGVPAQRKPWCAASRDNLGCLGTTPVDEFEPNGYELHTVSGNYWEWYSEWTHSRFKLRNAAQTRAADFSMRKVRG
jgi:formylglycine-generating enzyme required for sulfatase activity